MLYCPFPCYFLSVAELSFENGLLRVLFCGFAWNLYLGSGKLAVCALDFVSFREPGASLTPCLHLTLGNLAYNDSNQLAIAKAGAIPALVSLIIKSTPTAMERAISALGNLAFNDVNRKAIPKAGAIAPLVFLLTEGNQVMQEQSALALGEC
jgi:hypothetical protein